ncbi:DUF305 domain-containing protein [Kribbella sp. NBC_01245]|uniref:DUF305 domain-containing protein n=1 Tax=Kribbella sp. NBC_01245 TaxID=2903578 RepID=UPI002E2E4087|nr:DUF305 domain-containing protein [Kribbella sp. NBC_01245]
MKNRKRVAALVVAVAIGVAGCGGEAGDGSVAGGGPSGSAVSQGQFNEADVEFASHLIAHQQQAVQLANMAARRATTPAVKKLAMAIKAGQTREIQLMSGWLKAWGKPLPATGHGSHGTPLPGKLTEDEMSALGRTDGPEFDRLWTRMMIKHHKGAITMAKTQRTTGKNEAAVALAKKIETAQTREVATLQRMPK